MLLINKIFESIFPERTDARLVKHGTPDEMETFYQLQTTDHCVAALPFQNPLVRAAIHEVKFYRNERALALLLPTVERFLVTQTPSMVLPIPLSKERQRERGYNQAELLAKPVCQMTNHQYQPKILVRTRNTPSQTKLTRAERLENLKEAFEVPAAHRPTITGQHIILIDDVTTTGATLKAAKAALVEYKPASVVCFALAH